MEKASITDVLYEQCHHYEPNPDDFDSCPVTDFGPKIVKRKLMNYCLNCPYYKNQLEYVKSYTPLDAPPPGSTSNQ